MELRTCFTGEILCATRCGLPRKLHTVVGKYFTIGKKKIKPDDAAGFIKKFYEVITQRLFPFDDPTTQPCSGIARRL